MLGHGPPLEQFSHRKRVGEKGTKFWSKKSEECFPDPFYLGQITEPHLAGGQSVISEPGCLAW